MCIGLLVLCSRWAVRVEHRLRRHQPVAQAYESAVLPAAPAVDAPAAPARAAPARRSRRRGRRYGPVGTSVILGLQVIVALALVAGAISTYSQASRSSYVQHHGTEAGATVGSVDNTQHCSRSGCDWTAAIAVSLSPPVDGTHSTVVHYPDYSDLSAGDRVTVLVDPKQPGYAELPGSPFQSAWAWIVLAAFAVFFALLVAFEGRALLRQLAHRRAHQAQAAGGLATVAGP